MQSYLLPYALEEEGTHVALGRKVLLQWKVGGQWRNLPFVPNSAGQWAFSGGRRNEGETSYDAACREFLEETAIDLRPGSPWARRALGAVSSLLFDAQRREFSVLYFRFAPADLQRLAEEVRGNLGGQVPDDPEFDDFQVFEIGDAIRSRIGPAAQPRNGDWTPVVVQAVGEPGPLNTEVPRLAGDLARRSRAPSDWYQRALTHLRDNPDIFAATG